MEDPQGPWLDLAARIGHAVFYLFLIGLPLTGWYAASRLGAPVAFFGLPLPALTAAVQGRPGLIAEIHSNGGTIVLILGGLHGAIALWHQFVLRDGTLRRMSPV
jgi:cytochrome b561